MARHMEAWMDGVQLSTVGPVIISDFYDDAPSREISTGAIPGRYGQRVLTRKVTERTVTLALLIRELYDLPRRARTVDDIARWASGHVLEVSSRPGQRLRVELSTPPGVGAARTYTTEIRVGFTAYAVPFWEDTAAVAASATGTEGEVALYVPGTAPDTPVGVIVTPSSGTLTTLSLSLDSGDELSFTGLTATAAAPLIIGTDEEDRITITQGGVSCLSCRTGSDDLRAACGALCTLSFEADTACTVTASARGRWL